MAFSIIRLTSFLDLDFFSSIKFVNYIREQVKIGKLKPDVSSSALFQDDKYLRPTLEDDALLFSLDDLSNPLPEAQDLARGESAHAIEEASASLRIAELERQLQTVQSQFSDYRHQVEQTLEQRWNEAEGTNRSRTSTSGDKDADTKPDGIDFEGDYFESYSYNGIGVPRALRRLLSNTSRHS